MSDTDWAADVRIVAEWLGWTDKGSYVESPDGLWKVHPSNPRINRDSQCIFAAAVKAKLAEEDTGYSLSYLRRAELHEFRVFPGSRCSHDPAGIGNTSNAEIVAIVRATAAYRRSKQPS